MPEFIVVETPYEDMSDWEVTSYSVFADTVDDAVEIILRDYHDLEERIADWEEDDPGWEFEMSRILDYVNDGMFGVYLNVFEYEKPYDVDNENYKRLKRKHQGGEYMAGEELARRERIRKFLTNLNGIVEKDCRLIDEDIDFLVTWKLGQISEQKIYKQVIYIYIVEKMLSEHRDMLGKYTEIRKYAEIEEGKYSEMGVEIPMHVQEVLRIIRHK